MLLFTDSSTPMVFQEEVSECGIVCLAMVLAHFGRHVSLEELRDQTDRHASGITMRTLLKLAQANGLSGTAFRAEPEALKSLARPAILHWDMSHYVVLVSAGRHGIVINDPALGKRNASWREVDKSFTGIAVTFEKSEGFQHKERRQRLRTTQVLGFSPELRRSFLFALALTLVVQAAALIAPRYLQVSVDRVITESQPELLALIAVAFLAVTLCGLAASYLRSLVITAFAARAKALAKSRFVDHLLRLPNDFFARRRPVDVTSRLQSLDAIQDQFSAGAIEATVDAIAVAAALVIVLVAAPTLGGLALLSIVATVVVRQWTHARLMGANRDAIAASMIERSNLLDTVSAIEQLKALGATVVRQQKWMGLLYASTTASEKSGRNYALDELFQSLIPACLRILWLFVAVRMVLGASITIGELFALLAYSNIAFAQSQSLLRGVRDFRLLDVHFERVADVLTAKSDQLEPVSHQGSLDIDVSDVSFNYPQVPHALLAGVSFQIKEGEFIGITGVSGAGKTTLIKLLLGMLSPSHGRVLIGGVDASRLRKSQFASVVTGFLQGDTSLFEGTVLENVTLFDDSPDTSYALEVLSAVRLSEWVETLPNGVNTTLTNPKQVSGGQLQRIMLARALYQRPRILVLDESTSQLDEATELALMNWISSQAFTCVVVSHRRSVLERASRVLHVSAQGVAEVSAREG